MNDKRPTGPENVSTGQDGESGGKPRNSDDPRARRVGFPSAAVESLRSDQRQLDEDGVEIGVSRQAVDEVLAWIDHYVPRARQDMELSLGQDVGELIIEDEGLEVELIRMNGRTFVPEVAVVVDERTEFDLAVELADCPTSDETPGVAATPALDELIRLARTLTRSVGGDLPSIGLRERSTYHGQPVDEDARRVAAMAVDEALGPGGPGPFAPTYRTEGGSTRPVVHSEEAAIDRRDA